LSGAIARCGPAFGLGDGIPMTVFVKADGTIVSRLNGINTKEWFERMDSCSSWLASGGRRSPRAGKL
jgi:hypothetical protein